MRARSRSPQALPGPFGALAVLLLDSLLDSFVDSLVARKSFMVGEIDPFRVRNNSALTARSVPEPRH